MTLLPTFNYWYNMQDKLTWLVPFSWCTSNQPTYETINFHDRRVTAYLLREPCGSIWSGCFQRKKEIAWPCIVFRSLTLKHDSSTSNVCRTHCRWSLPGRGGEGGWGYNQRLVRASLCNKGSWSFQEEEEKEKKKCSAAAKWLSVRSL